MVNKATLALAALVASLASFPSSVSAAVFVVTNAGDSGAGSLRQALTDAVNSPELNDVIQFNIPGAGPHTIQPLTPLPQFSGTTIDGYTQPGSSPNTLEVGSDALLRIELDGSLVATGGANQRNGLFIAGGGVTVRGLVINRFRDHGIRSFFGDGSTIEGCFIGTDVTGTQDLGNGLNGLLVDGANWTIGGDTPAARNLISGNGLDGAALQDEFHLVQGNYIGTDASGLLPLGNSGNGIRSQDDNLIGGTTASTRNVVSANGGSGILVIDHRTTVQGNYVGVGADGTTPLGNSFHGIELAFGNDCTIGGTAPGEGNVVAHNGEDGVFLIGEVIGPVMNGHRNTIRGNSIFENTDLGIDLFTDAMSEVNSNDMCDLDQDGANFLQNHPVLTAALSSVGGGSVTIDGTLDSTASTQFTLDFYVNLDCDPSGHGEGEIYLGSASVTTDSSCMGQFSAVLPTFVGDGLFVTATVTDPASGTSEFSACQEVTADCTQVAFDDVTCDDVDDDCDGTFDEDYASTPTTCGVGACAAAGDLVCQNGTETDTCQPGTPSTETCDEIDNDCDGSVDEGFDTDGDGFTSCGGDCNDGNSAINPDATEVCDLVDNDCDIAVDEGFDTDGDGFTSCGGDCNDANPAINPDATEICDLADNDCDGPVDEGFDTDGDGFTSCGGDCNDANPAINPDATEVCDLADNDCDATVDEGFDADSDGFTSCGGDCDDTEPLANPGQEEVCDGIDNDCDGTVDEDVDSDGDGFTTCGGDCDDANPAINPDATEVCDLADNDCDGTVDEGFDADGDGFATCGGDCNDGSAAVHPGATEVCDLADNDCDIAVDEGFDTDGDGFTSCGGDCDDGDSGINPDATELCDLSDNDCDGTVDEGFDADSDGSTSCGGDCNDGNPAIHPGATEVCDLVDNDCDATVDEGFDSDGDGFTSCGGDCDDTEPLANPGREEICDGIDNNCDGTVDEDVDKDKDGFTTCAGDCNDGNPAINPDATEVCDLADNDCDGMVDEGFDADGDGFSTCGGDCDDTEPLANPGRLEACDGIDNDCSGSVPANETDADSDGFRVCDNDCDEADPAIHPGATEICDDTLDNDCDGMVDLADLNCIVAITRCSTLGDEAISADDVDQDIWTFTGMQGETVTIDLAPGKGETTGHASLYLLEQVGAGLVQTQRGLLPSRIVAMLPAAGTYRIAVAEQPPLIFLPRPAFTGDYCLTVEGDQGAAATLAPTSSVEGTSVSARPSEPRSAAPGRKRPRASDRGVNRRR